MAEDKRPSTLAVLLGSGGIGGVILAFIAVAEFIGGNGPNETAHPPPAFSPAQITQPPIGETAAPRVEPTPAPPTELPTPGPTTRHFETPQSVPTVDYWVGLQFSGADGLVADRAAVRINGQDVGVIEVHAGHLVDELALTSEAGQVSYELSVVSTYDYGLGPQSFNSYGTGVIDVGTWTRFGVRYDGFGAATLVGVR